MTEDQVVLPIRRQPLLKPLLIAIPVLFALAVALNWQDVSAIAAGRRSLREVVTGRTYRPSAPSYRFPDPVGSPDAKVRVKVVAMEGDSCHEPLVALWLGIGELDPKHIRVEFLNPGQLTPASPTGKPVELGCNSGVLINGQNKFTLGREQGQRTIYLNGPMPEPPAGAGGSHGPGGHGWTTKDVATILNRLIESKYGKPGSFTAPTITVAAKQAFAKIPPASHAQPNAPAKAAPKPAAKPD
jgi:hypothetical protein